MESARLPLWEEHSERLGALRETEGCLVLEGENIEAALNLNSLRARLDLDECSQKNNPWCQPC